MLLSYISMQAIVLDNGESVAGKMSLSFCVHLLEDKKSFRVKSLF